MRYSSFVALAVAVAAAELILIMAGAVAPLMYNSIGNMLFSLIEVALIAALGWGSAREGVKKAALKGAGLMLACAALLGIATIVGMQSGRPVLGIAATKTQLAFILAIVAAENMLLGALIAAASAWLAGRTALNKKKSGRQKKGG